MSDTFDPKQFLSETDGQTSSSTIPTDETQVSNFNPQNYLAAANNEDYTKQQEQYGGLSNEIAAPFLKAGRTLGFTPIYKALGYTPEQMEGIEQANPVGSAIGSLGGPAAALAMTGGASSLAEGAGTAAKFAASALEGGVLGGLQSIDEASMGDPTLNAQKVLTNTGLGMAGGLFAHGLVEGAGAVLSPVTKKLKSALDKASDMFSSTGDTASNLSTVATPTEQFKLGLQLGPKGQLIKSKEFINNIQNVADASKAAASDLYEKAFPERIKPALSQMSPEVAHANVSNMLDEAEQLAYGATTPEGTVPSIKSPSTSETFDLLLNNTRSKLNNADTAYDKFQVGNNFRQKVDKSINYNNLLPSDDLADQGILKRIRDNSSQSLSDPVQWGDEASTHYQAINDTYHKLSDDLKLLHKDLFTNRGTSKRPNWILNPGKATSLFGNLDSESNAIKVDQLQNFFKTAKTVADQSENYSNAEQGSKSISSYISELAKKHDELSQVASIISKKTSSIPDAVIAGGTIASHSLGLPGLVSGTLGGLAKAYETMKNPYQAGVQLNNTFSVFKGIGDILQKVNSSLDSGAKSIFSGNIARAVSVGLSNASLQNYNKNVSKINSLSNDPQALINHLNSATQGMQAALPNISGGMQGTMQNAIYFLNQKIPRVQSQLPLNSPGLKPSPSQQIKFNKYFHAVNNPMDALKQVKLGTYSSEMHDTLTNVYPQLLKEMQSKVMAEMTPKRISTLNYSTKIALSKFLGQPLENAMLPQVIASNQAALQMPSSTSPQGAQQGQKRGRSTLGGMKELDLGNRELTRTEHLEKEPV